MVRQLHVAFAACIGLAPLPVSGQYAETIRSGRPGQAIGPFAVGARVFQVQTGVEWGTSSMQASTATNRSHISSTVLRLGLATQVEFNAALDFRDDRMTYSAASPSHRGLSRAAFGTRMHLVDPAGARPSVGLQLTIGIPARSAVDPSLHAAPGVTLIASRQLSNRTAVLVNVGESWSGVDQSPKGAYVVNVGHALTNRWSMFAENYGDRSNGVFQLRWDGGVAYAATPDLQLDLFAGVGRNGTLHDSFVNAGLSWRSAALRKSARTTDRPSVFRSREAGLRTLGSK